jgi:cytosine/adenosine deaminase-related metal-dependent hydrolase
VDGFLGGGRPLGPAAITVAAGRIARIEAAPAPGTGIYALPGFANAHVHLDLSSIRGEEMPRRGFAAWIDGLIDRRARLSREDVEAAVDAGIGELLRNGCVAVGDVDSFGFAAGRLRSSPLEGVAYREWLGAAPAAPPVAGDDDRRDPIRTGISPHAPYSTSQSAFAAAFELARSRATPAASHVAESEDEERFLRRGDGPLAELFARRGFAAPAWELAGGSAERVFALAPPAERFAVVHGNLLSGDAMKECARRRWPLVHCPRSRRFLGHPQPPLRELLAAGGVRALAAAARASNDRRAPWREMECLRACEPGLADAAIVEAATAGGRRALGLEPAELVLGHPATLQLARARDRGRVGARDLAAAAARGELETIAVLVRGRCAFGDAEAAARP